MIVALDPGDDTSGQLVQRMAAARPRLPGIADTGLHVPAPRAGERGSHRFYRTTIAPLVRRLYDVRLLNRTS